VRISGKWKKNPLPQFCGTGLAPFVKGELPLVVIQKFFKYQTGLDFKKI
jgi:hypothetical protein